MKVTGITAEYNPLHSGHVYQMRECADPSREDGALVVIMSGDFVQRGAPAVFSKFARAEAAVRCGASLVIELPLPWCLSSAEGFARGAVRLMQATGVVDSLSFGCESGDGALLEKTADALLSPRLGEKIREKLSAGISFPAAREKAAAELFGSEISEPLRRPNDLLGIEYIKACRVLGADMEIRPVLRENSVHDGAGSASELREHMRKEPGSLAGIPDEARAVYQREQLLGRGPVWEETLRLPLLSRLRACRPGDFSVLPDAGEGLENRLYAAARQEISPEAVAMAAKSKRYTLSRLRRMTMCAALGITKEHTRGLPPYIRVLAMDDKGKGLLREMNGRASLPVIIKPASARELEPTAREIFELGSFAHDLYVLGCSDPAQQRGGGDWRTTPFVLPHGNTSCKGE